MHFGRSRGHVITELGKPTLLAAKQWKFAHSSETGPPPRARHALKISPVFTIASLMVTLVTPEEGPTMTPSPLS